MPDPMTDPQADYIETNRKRLRIDRAVFDQWAQERYGVPIAQLDKAQASDVLDRLIAAETVPVDILKVAGIEKPVMPGFEGL